jgi:hypothetical protein
VLVNEGEGWRDGKMGGVGEWVLEVAHLEGVGLAFAGRGMRGR